MLLNKNARLRFSRPSWISLRFFPLSNASIFVSLAFEYDTWDGGAEELDRDVGCWAAGGSVENVAGNWISRCHLGENFECLKCNAREWKLEFCYQVNGVLLFLIEEGWWGSLEIEV
jgi:hypothetical protein